MRTVVLNVLILIALVFFVSVYVYLSAHDRIEEAMTLEDLLLGRGRIVHLVGIDGVIPFETTDEDSLEMPDNSYIERFEAFASTVSGLKVSLQYPDYFSEDSSSTHLFAYVHGPERGDLGAWLLREGFVRVHPEHEHDKLEEYRQLETAARNAGLGIWAMEHSDGASDADNDMSAE